MGWVIAIPLLPALAFVVLLPLSRAMRAHMRWLSVGAVAGSLVLSVAAFLAVLNGPHAGPIYHVSTVIATVGGAPLNVGLQLDEVSAIMLLVVTVVGTCVQVFSLSYMHGDARRGWYFAVLSLFTAAMLTLVLADDFLLLYMAWEVMGLCSYLLIGFWHEEAAPRAASMKAFITTRIGDVGFAIGLAVMWGTFHSFDFSVVLAGAAAIAPAAATAIALLLLAGAAGKSAQVPLHVWLPDAMAGPTPASALIHAATMVAAGVYLVGRSLPLFHAAYPAALTTVLWIGTITALMAGVLAVVQYDIKKILAYSTISQLGYMFMGLGAGADVAAFWHLTTHAFFKSLLFLGAGAIIHATHTQDIREMGGLRRSMPKTTVAFTAGALALAGVFPFAGFWSKDEILASLFEGGHFVPFAVALLTALLTAFYVGRLWFRVFGGAESETHGHEADWLMLAPMFALAAITTALGPFTPSFTTLLGDEGRWPNIALAGASTLVVVGGLTAAWWVYARRGVDTERMKSRFAGVYAALTEKLYFDRVYDAVLVRPYMSACDALSRFDAVVIDGAVNGAATGWSALASASSIFDTSVVDGMVNGLGALVKEAGARVRRLQVGRLQTYQRLVFAALLVLIAWLILKGA